MRLLLPPSFGRRGRHWSIPLLAFGLFVDGGCGGSAGTAGAGHQEPPAAQANAVPGVSCPLLDDEPPSSPPPVGPPTLVVAVVYDQLASHALERIEPLLDENGALAWTAQGGVRVRRLRYGHAATYTASGHATLFTGAHPRDHGVPANAIWSFEGGRKIQAVDDGEHAVLGAEGRTAGPGILAVEGVADVLEAETGGRARTVSLSLKDRGAILPGGHRPDVALWLEGARFTTSRYVAEAVPDFVSAFEDRAGPPSLAPWTPALPAARYEAVLGPDDRAGEVERGGFGRTFPHDPRALGDAAGRVLPVLASTSVRLVALAREAVCALGLGTDDVPDLLALSVSGTDYTGHGYGPGSWEFADHVRRADAAVGGLVRALAARIPIAVLVTSDHGVVPLAEAPRPAGPDFDPYGERWTPRRVASGAVVARAEEALVGVAGAAPAGGWVTAFVEPFLVVRDDGFHDPRERERAVRAAASALGGLDGIDQALVVADLVPPEALEDGGVRGRVAASIPVVPGRRPPGDLYLVLSPGASFDLGLGDAGTSHGSPWRYDTDVPAHLRGPGASAGTVIDGPQDARRVAATLTEWLGVRPPASAVADPLPGSGASVEAYPAAKLDPPGRELRP